MPEARDGKESDRLAGLLPSAEVVPDRLSPAALAYLGDAVYELHARSRHLWPPQRLTDYHRAVVEDVRAEAQSERLHDLEPHLSDAEREIVRRGRNAATKRPRRLAPEIYQRATSLEALLGYLFLSDPRRLREVLQMLVE